MQQADEAQEAVGKAGKDIRAQRVGGESSSAWQELASFHFLPTLCEYTYSHDLKHLYVIFIVSHLWERH